MRTPFTYGTLFTGIGGLDLGLERAGMHCQWQVEIDAYATQVLQKHWPDVTRFRDIRECGAHNLAPVDLIAGGFPCQDISEAGKRAGIEGEQSGLWKEFARIIRELRPRYVLVENVAALTRRGLDRVLGDLAACRYDAEWMCLRASDFGAPHQRERIFILAYPHGYRCGQRQDQPQRLTSCLDTPNTGTDGPQGAMADTCSARWQEQHASAVAGVQSHTAWRTRAPGSVADTAGERCQEQLDTSRLYNQSHPSSPWTIEPILGGMPDGFSTWLDRHHWPAGPGETPYEWEPQRVITGPIPHREKRLRGLGNAVIPQIAEYIGRCILCVHYD